MRKPSYLLKPAPYRGLTKDGKLVKGWYAEVDGISYIINPDAGMAKCECGGHGFAGFVEVDPETVDRSVTKDKNNKDVFLHDTVKGIIHDVSSEPLIGQIVPNESPPNKYGIRGCLMFKWKFEGKEYLAPAPDLNDIELIEEEQ